MAEKNRWSVFPKEHKKEEVSLPRKQKKHSNIKLKSFLLILFNIILLGIYVYSYGSSNVLGRFNYGFSTLELPVIFELLILSIFIILTLLGIVFLIYYIVEDLISSHEQLSEKRILHSWYETKFDVDIVIIVAILIRLIIQPFSVYGSSMEPNFHNQEYIIVNEVSYKMHKPARGDVIVFKFPQNKNKIYIKRIIGLPGEHLIAKDNQVMIYNQNYHSGIELRENYIPSEAKTLARNNDYSDIVLKDNEYYVMGDNREASSDSREWGPLPSDLIIGKAWIVCWPFADWQVIQMPSYNLTTSFIPVYNFSSSANL